MTTTGDLFVNIKGNNRGLKQSLNQSSRDIGRFGQKTQQQMGGKGGLGFGDMAALAGITNLGKIGSAFKTLNQARQLNNLAPGIRLNMAKMSRSSATDKARAVDIHANKTGNIASYRQAIRDQAFHRANARTWIRKAKEERDGVKAAEAYINPAKRFAAPGMLAAVAAVAGAVLVANGKKWADRINESAMQFSGAAIGNQARLDAANMRRDIQLAKSGGGSAIFRQNAADFRKNSGAGGQVTNFLGGAYDAAVGAGSNAIFGIPGLIMNIKQISDTVGGPK